MQGIFDKNVYSVQMVGICMINFYFDTSLFSLILRRVPKEQRSELITKSNYEVIIQTDLIPYITIWLKFFKDKKIQNRIMEKQMHVEKVGIHLYISLNIILT